MIGRVNRLAAIAWGAIAAGAGLGFVARDLLGLPMALVALAWTAGALAVAARARACRVSAAIRKFLDKRPG